MIFKTVSYDKVKLTKIDEEHYKKLQNRDIDFFSNGIDIRPVIVMYDNNNDSYLVLNGNGITIGYKLKQMDVEVTVLEEKDDLKGVENSLHRIRKVYRKYDSCFSQLKEKATRISRELDEKLETGEITKEIYSLFK